MNSSPTGLRSRKEARATRKRRPATTAFRRAMNRTVAATMNEDAGTLEDVVEPFLLQIGFLARTRRGRALTRRAIEHLGLPIKPPEEAGGLFE